MAGVRLSGLYIKMYLPRTWLESTFGVEPVSGARYNKIRLNNCGKESDMIGEKERYFMEAAKRFNILWTIKTFFFYLW